MHIQLSTDSTTQSITDYLLHHKLLDTSPQKISLSKPGEGNMNFVLRYTYDDQSLILKQSKPYVNKYPSIPAPQERIHTEAMFYQYAQQIETQVENMPKLLHYDPDNFLIVMEDLGAGNDLLELYEPTKRLGNDDLKLLLQYLNDLHLADWSAEEKQQYPDNLKLRQLNHQHIFVLPFQTDNGFDLDSIQAGLADVARPYTEDLTLKDRIGELGERYLSKGTYLLHGDYYPGSWMRTQSGIKIIDPEFSFMGEVEFELGVLMGHLLLAGHERSDIEMTIYNHYEQRFDAYLVHAYAGIEMMRRLIGIAQLPLTYSIPEKQKLMQHAHDLIV
ncbi:MAG: phosphotransferase [Bacteroidota bacterium]